MCLYAYGQYLQRHRVSLKYIWGVVNKRVTLLEKGWKNRELFFENHQISNHLALLVIPSHAFYYLCKRLFHKAETFLQKYKRFLPQTEINIL